MKWFCKLLFLAFAIFLSSCSKEDHLALTDILQNETFTTDLRVEGHDFDSLIIENCVFDGATLNIGNVNHVIIRNCTFKDIKGNGLQIGFIGTASDILIDSCIFENIGYSAIDSHEDAPDCIIQKCTFRDVALSEVGAAMGQPHHSIYWKGKNVTIQNNVFYGGRQRFGNAISVRSSGSINSNIIIDSPQNGIMYYSDHPGGDSLYIENNFLIYNRFSITLASAGELSWHNDKIVIRFNSMIQKENRSIFIGEDFETTTIVEIYGNLISNPTAEYFKTYYTLSALYGNYTSVENPGFINVVNNNLHLESNSPAIDYCIDVNNFPAFDIDGDLRFPGPLNAGADE